MGIDRLIRLFKMARGQAVRIPQEPELSGEAAAKRKARARIVIRHAPSLSLLGLLASLGPIEEDLGTITDDFPEPNGL